MGSNMSLEKPAVLHRIFAKADTATAHKRPAIDDDVSLAISPTKRRRLAAEKNMAVVHDALVNCGTSTAKKRAAPDDDGSIEARPPKRGRTEGQDHNIQEAEKRCRILQLPEELQLSIMKLLEPEDLFLLQRTCRSFFHMSFDSCFGNYFREEGRFSRSAYPEWRLSSYDTTLDQDKVAPLVQADRFCQPCRQARSVGSVNKKRKRLLNNKIYCSGCRKKHPKLLFSSKQRAAPSWKRKCIGREGWVRVCPHQVMNWGYVEKLRATGAEEYDIPCKECEKSYTSSPRHPPLTRFVSYRNPGLEPRYSWKKSSDYIHVSMTFRVFRYDQGQEIDLEGLKSAWRACFKHPWLKRIICPHIDPESDQLLAPFGAGRCACLGATPGHRERHGHQPFCCACESEIDPGRAGKLIPGWSGPHTYDCSCCRQSKYRWYREGDDWVYLEVNRFMELDKGPASEDWLVHMSPESYSIADDKFTRHVTWCVDESCAARERWAAAGRLLREMARKEEAREWMRAHEEEVAARNAAAQ